MEPKIQNIDVLYCSTERKAQLTASGLMKALSKENFSDLRIDKRLMKLIRIRVNFNQVKKNLNKQLEEDFLKKRNHLIIGNQQQLFLQDLTN